MSLRVPCVPFNGKSFHPELYDIIKDHLNLKSDNKIVEIYTFNGKIFTINRNLSVDDENTIAVCPFTRDFLKMINPFFVRYLSKTSDSDVKVLYGVAPKTLK